MLWIGLFLIGVYSYCETNCYANCLVTDTLNACSQECCVFDNIQFDNGKVLYFDGNAFIEVELEDTYYEMPVYDEYVPPPVIIKPYQPAEEKPEVKEEPQFESMCERKCYKRCETNTGNCFNKCTDKYCMPKEIPSSPDYFLWLLLGLASLYILKRLFTPKKYLDGYFKLE